MHTPYTSQTCSRNPVWGTGNGHRQKMPLSERTYHCPCCLLSLDRDVNASGNILALGLQCRVIPEATGFSRRE
ncbi:MAG: zinc ribbon domain-containing protein [Ktedonobacteraceae bacterium]